MFGIGFTELILIAIVLLVVIGPEKLPDIAKDIAKLFGQVKKGTDEVKRSIRAEATDLKRWVEIEDEPYRASGADGEEETDYSAEEPASEADDGSGQDSDDDPSAAWRPANTWLPTPEQAEEKPEDNSKEDPATEKGGNGDGGDKSSTGGVSS